jgi:hypothetical protein
VCPGTGGWGDALAGVGDEPVVFAADGVLGVTPPGDVGLVDSLGRGGIVVPSPRRLERMFVSRVV